MVAHPEALAGRSSAEKRAEIARGLIARDLAAAVLTLPDSIAWLLNVRGSDIGRTPVALAFAILGADGRVELFTDPGKADDAVRAHLGPEVRVEAPSAFGPALDRLKGRVAVDRASAPVWVSDRIAAAGQAEVVWERDPCILPKAVKNPGGDRRRPRGAPARRGGDGGVPRLARCDGARGRAERDRRGDAARGDPRRDRASSRDISFETISRRRAERRDRALPGHRGVEPAGGAGRAAAGRQRRAVSDGTTDITRTVAVGPVPAAAVRPFTLVLKGLIAMCRLRWPEGLAGRDIDAVARMALWRAGIDYDHGTGHGIGSYLGVHEGPQSLSRRGLEPLLPGMILSIEPGYYREGAFGIRHREPRRGAAGRAGAGGGDREMLSFEVLTLAPIDRRLIDARLLEPSERAWLDAYHARVAETLAPLVEPETARWLRAACQPL